MPKPLERVLITKYRYIKIWNFFLKELGINFEIKKKMLGNNWIRTNKNVFLFLLKVTEMAYQKYWKYISMNEIHVLTFKVLTLTLILGQIEPYHTHTTPMIYYILKVLYSFIYIYSFTFLDKIFFN